jgi:hypothetical protein
VEIDGEDIRLIPHIKPAAGMKYSAASVVPPPAGETPLPNAFLQNVDSENWDRLSGQNFENPDQRSSDPIIEIKSEGNSEKSPSLKERLAPVINIFRNKTVRSVIASVSMAVAAVGIVQITDSPLSSFASVTIKTPDNTPEDIPAPTPAPEVPPTPVEKHDQPNYTTNIARGQSFEGDFEQLHRFLTENMDEKQIAQMQELDSKYNRGAYGAIVKKFRPYLESGEINQVRYNPAHPMYGEMQKAVAQFGEPMKWSWTAKKLVKENGKFSMKAGHYEDHYAADVSFYERTQQGYREAGVGLNGNVHHRGGKAGSMMSLTMANGELVPYVKEAYRIRGVVTDSATKNIPPPPAKILNTTSPTPAPQHTLNMTPVNSSNDTQLAGIAPAQSRYTSPFGTMADADAMNDGWDLPDTATCSQDESIDVDLSELNVETAIPAVVAAAGTSEENASGVQTAAGAGTAVAAEQSFDNTEENFFAQGEQMTKVNIAQARENAEFKAQCPEWFEDKPQPPPRRGVTGFVKSLFAKKTPEQQAKAETAKQIPTKSWLRNLIG